MIKGSSLLNRSIAGRAALFLILLPLSASQVGCIGPCGAVPVVLLPLILPPALISQAIDNQPGWSNADFILAGQVVNDRGEPIDSVEAQITASTATHRNDGFADRWKSREERRTLGPSFGLTEKNAQAVDIVFRHPGYRDQRIVITHGIELPPSAQIRRDTQIRSEGAIEVRDLEGGGTLYWAGDDKRPVRKNDLRIAMERTPDGS